MSHPVALCNASICKGNGFSARKIVYEGLIIVLTYASSEGNIRVNR